jgi:hypothetical protein
MTKEDIIERTIRAINLLPDDKAAEIADFAEFISKRYEEYLLTQGIRQLTAQSEVFDFLHHEEDLYTTDDLKEIYNG